MESEEFGPALLVSYLGRAISQLLTLISTVLIVRILTIEQFGAYNVFFAFLFYLAIFSSYGVLHSFVRYFPLFKAKRQLKHINSLFLWGLRTRTILLVAILGLFALSSPPILALLKLQAYQKELYLFILVIFFVNISRLFETALDVLYFQKEKVLANIYSAIVRLAGMAIVFYAGRTLYLVLAVELFANVIWAAVLAYYYWLKIFMWGTQKLESNLHGRIAQYAKHHYLADFGDSVMDTSTSYYVVSALGGALSAGIFAFVNGVYEMSTRWIPSRVSMNLIKSKFFASISEADNARGKLSKIFVFITKIDLLTYSIPIVLIMVFNKEVAGVVAGGKYLGHATLFYVVGLGTLLNSTSYALGSAVQALEKSEVIYRSRIFALANIFFSVILFKFFGLAGVAIANASAILLRNTYQLVRIWQYLDAAYLMKSFRKLGGFLGGWVLACFALYQLYVLGLHAIFVILLLPLLAIIACKASGVFEIWEFEKLSELMPIKNLYVRQTLRVVRAAVIKEPSA